MMRLLLLTPLVLSSLVAAVATPKLDTRFSALIRTAVGSESRSVLSRDSLSLRQTTTCATQCASAADQAAFTQGEACGSADVACACAALALLDSTCLSCELQSEGLTQAEYESTCSNASSGGSGGSSGGSSGSQICPTQCASTTDEAALTTFGTCGNSDLACQCTALEAMDSTCLACVLAANDDTQAQYESSCSSTSGGSGGGSSGGGSSGSCSTECSSASDQAAVSAGAACTTDACLCTAYEELSATCLSCVLQASDVTESTYDSQCSTGSSGGSGGGSLPTTTPASLPPANTLPDNTPTTTSSPGGGSVPTQPATTTRNHASGKLSKGLTVLLLPIVAGGIVMVIFA